MLLCLAPLLWDKIVHQCHVNCAADHVSHVSCVMYARDRTCGWGYEIVPSLSGGTRDKHQSVRLCARETVRARLTPDPEAVFVCCRHLTD